MNFDNVVPGLVVIIYVIVEILKKTVLKTNKSRKHIPLVSCIAGIITGITIFCIWPSVMGCSNVLEAIAMGGLSGFAATGCNQLYKQYSRYNGTSTEEIVEEEEKDTATEKKEEEVTSVIDSSSSDGEGF